MHTLNNSKNGKYAHPLKLLDIVTRWEWSTGMAMSVQINYLCDVSEVKKVITLIFCFKFMGKIKIKKKEQNNN